MSSEGDNQYLSMTDVKLKEIKYSSLSPDNLIKFCAACQIRTAQFKCWQDISKLEFFNFSNCVKNSRDQFEKSCSLQPETNSDSSQ